MKDILSYIVADSSWDQDRFGNHRAVIKVENSGEIAWVRIPWRRRDRDVESKKVLLTKADGLTLINEIYPVETDRHKGMFLFRPVDGAGVYYIYFMPYGGNVDSYYPTAEYLPAEYSTDFLKSSDKNIFASADCGIDKRYVMHNFLQAECTALESVSEFHRFTDMERPASPQETEKLLRTNPDKTFLVFAEPAENVIRMRHDIPVVWTERRANHPFEVSAKRGEFVSFQLGIFAGCTELENVRVEFSDLLCGDSAIDASRMCSFNLNGIGWDGKPFSKMVTVRQGDVQALWCGVDVDRNCAPGIYSGSITVEAEGLDYAEIEFVLTVEDESIHDHGDDNPQKLSRLRWLNSQIGTEDTLFAPFTAVEVSENRISILGREIELNEHGLPLSIKSRFSEDNTQIMETASPVTAGALRFVVEDSSGSEIELSGKTAPVSDKDTAAAEWKAVSSGKGLRIDTKARIELDGCVEYSVAVYAKDNLDLNDIRLEIPFTKPMSKYMLGLGRKGGLRPKEFEWCWGVKQNQDSIWLGGINGGIQLQLKDQNYERPLNTNFYHLKPLIMPESWDNNGRGRIRISEEENRVILSCSSGARKLKAGEILHYNFRMLLTPFKTIDTSAHFNTRYHHSPDPIKDVVKKGGNVINVHHANAINPWINYPFLSVDKMRDYISKAHAEDVRVKLYYTVRELTTRAPELFALHSLDGEIIVKGDNKPGHAWLQEHLEEEYIAAWFAKEIRDTSVINGVLSRWHNFYVEGMDWLARNLEVDGLYLDDIGYGREVLKRIRRVLAKHRPNPEIDLHSANQYNEKDGYAGSLNLYMDCLPFLDRIWFGEYFDYNENPDYWLTEISGIPFGLMGEMLQDDGNRWRGMIYGMTGRGPRVDNSALWKFWDEQGLPDMRMHGYWDSKCPVTVNHDDVRCTVYMGEKRAVIALANWGRGTAVVKMQVDWKSFGINPQNFSILQPEIEDFQKETDIEIGSVKVPGGKGCLLVLRRRIRRYCQSLRHHDNHCDILRNKSGSCHRCDD